jgi:hypothetical protein
MATKKKASPEKAKAKLKLRAAIMDAQEKKVTFAEREKALRLQLRAM